MTGHVNTRIILFDLPGLNHLPQTAPYFIFARAYDRIKKAGRTIADPLEVKLLNPNTWQKPFKTGLDMEAWAG